VAWTILSRWRGDQKGGETKAGASGGGREGKEALNERNGKEKLGDKKTGGNSYCSERDVGVNSGETVTEPKKTNC